MSEARDQIDVTHYGRAEFGREKIVAQRVLLRVVPQGRNRIPVVVAHRKRSARRRHYSWRAAGGSAGMEWEQVQQTAVIGLLFVLVMIVVVAGTRLRPIEAEWIDRSSEVGAVKRSLDCWSVEPRSAHSPSESPELQRTAARPGDWSRSDTSRNSDRTSCSLRRSLPDTELEWPWIRSNSVVRHDQASAGATHLRQRR